MAVPTNDLSAYKGEDYSVNFEVSASVTSDITGWTIVCTVKLADADAVPALTVNGTVTDGPNRRFKIDFTAANMTTLLVGTYLYDIWRTNAGTAWVLSVGNLTVKSERRVPVP